MANYGNEASAIEINKKIKSESSLQNAAYLH